MALFVYPKFTDVILRDPSAPLRTKRNAWERVYLSSSLM